MFKRAISLLIVTAVLVGIVGCTPASKDLYSTFTELAYRDPETGEFVDPDEFAARMSSRTESSGSDDAYNSSYSSGSSSANSGETVDERKTVIINVKDYGAVGDGVTDDGNAIANALTAFMKGGNGSKLIFEPKSYYIKDNDGRFDRALVFRNMTESEVIGNGATIIAGGSLGFMTISDCKSFSVSGFNFDRKIRAHFVGTVTNINTQDGYCDIVSDRDFGFYDEYTPSKDIFAFAEKERGVGNREYIFMSKLALIDKATLTYRFYPNKSGALGTWSHFCDLKEGQRIIVPTPYVGHMLSDSFSIGGNSDLYCKDINAWNNAEFVFHINGNPGKITLENVNIVPAPDETVCFSSWRDGFHCKTNSSAIIWKNCKAVGLGDDIINISSNMMYVCNKYADDEIACFWSEAHGGSYGNVEVGAKVTIFDCNTGKLIAKTAVKRVVSKEDNRYQLANKIPNLKTGENICFYIDSHAAPDSRLINCDFEGTLRFKGAGGVAENCRLKLYAMSLRPESRVEGPIPHDITFSNCDFAGTWKAGLIVTCDSPVPMWKEGCYRLENIRFENCSNLTKSLFSNELNFNEKSVDYITVTPAPAD